MADVRGWVSWPWRRPPNLEVGDLGRKRRWRRRKDRRNEGAWGGEETDKSSREEWEQKSGEDGGPEPDSRVAPCPLPPS